MHCLDTISKLNRQEAIKPRPSATHRIKALRDFYREERWRLHDTNKVVLLVRSQDFKVFADELDQLISRIERDEKEVS